RSLFAGPKGTKIKVSTSRGGTLRTVELERTPLINEPGS
ncbi:MAG: hypothetical protein C4320_00345, partial [Armatimonadota bacterium]